MQIKMALTFHPLPTFPLKGRNHVQFPLPRRERARVREIIYFFNFFVTNGSLLRNVNRSGILPDIYFYPRQDASAIFCAHYFLEFKLNDPYQSTTTS
jgi:hypothetical protein